MKTQEKEITNYQLFNLIERFSNNVDKRFDKIEQRLDKIEDRLDKVEQRLDKVEVRLDNIEERLSFVETDLKATQAAALDNSKAIEECNLGVQLVQHQMSYYETRFGRLERHAGLVPSSVTGHISSLEK